MKLQEMKTTKPFRVVIGILALAMSLSSCIDPDYFPCVRTEGPLVEESRMAPAFDGVDMRLHAQVLIVQGQEYSVKVEAPANVQHYINTRVSGGSLIIEQTRCIRNRMDEIRVYITMPEIRNITMMGSGSIELQDVWTAENIYVDISGSGKITGTFNCHFINTRISGSGDVYLSGKTINQNINISGSGRVNAFSFEAQNTDIRISGSGNANVSVADNLEARISGSGNVYYKGNPNVSAHVSGSGRIIRR